MGKSEIGRILHLKFEIRNRKLDSRMEIDLVLFLSRRPN
jgi:hypothetical protein